MPVYEFACNACGADVSVFVRSISAPVEGKCERCGSTDLLRLVSRFAVLRSSGGGDFGDFDEGMLDGLDENDPRALATMARRMRDELGGDVDPEMDEMIGRMERGEGLDGLGFDDGFDTHDHDDDLF
jgi:putative FmdB family regulatory protein